MRDELSQPVYGPFPIETIVEIDPGARDELARVTRDILPVEDSHLREPSIQRSLSVEFSRGFAEWRDLAQRIASTARSHGFALVRGLNFDEENRLSAGLTAGFATIVEPYTEPYAKVVREIGVRPGVETLHTDGTGWVVPNDLTLLECVEPDPAGGGASLLSRVDDAINLLTHEQSTIEVLTRETAPFMVDTELGGGVKYLHILTIDPQTGRYSVQFHSYDTDNLVAKGADIKPIVKEAMKRFEASLDSPSVCRQQLMTKGDWLIVDNHHTLHARTAVQMPSTRLLKRIKANWQ